MANPYVNKVIYGSEVLIDLTSDTVNGNSLLSGVTAHDKSGAPITGTIQTVSGGNTITPSTVNQIAIAAGKYTEDAIIVAGDVNLVAANIAQGVQIFGITGTHSGGASAYAYIFVTYPVGGVCTCTSSDGTIVYTATDTTGFFTFSVEHTGTWTIRAENEETEQSAEVDVIVSLSDLHKTLTASVAYLEDFYIFTAENGDVTELTGGWKRTVNNGTVTTTWTDDYGHYAAYLAQVNTGGSSVTTNNAIDLTGYNKITFEARLPTQGSGNPNHYAFWVNKTAVSGVKLPVNMDSYKLIELSDSYKSYTLDISDLEGSYYIGFSNANTSNPNYTFVTNICIAL